MAEDLWNSEEDRSFDGAFDLCAFAEEHDLALGEARQIIREAGCDKTEADKLAHRTTKW